VAGVFMAQLFMVGFYTYGYPLIIVPVKADFEASDKEVNLIMTVGSVIGLVAPPLIGPLVDRWSARGLMLIGTVALISAFGVLSVTQSIYQFAVVFALLVGSANVMLGPMAGSALVSRWFTASRGRALGIAAAGTSVGGMLLPPMIAAWVLAWGWRSTLQALAVLVLLFVLPLIVFVLRDHPADKGLAPEGSEGVSSEAVGENAEGRNWSTREVLTSRSYWLIGCCLGLLFMSYTAVLSNLGLYVTGQGIHVSSTTTLVGAVALFGLIGKLVLGYAADRVGLRSGLWIALGLAGTGILIFSFEPIYAWMIVASVLMGLAAGGMLPVWGGLVAAAFGTASFGRVMGLLMPVISVLVMPGFMIAGASSDATGSFTLAMRIFVGLIGLAALLLLGLQLPGSPGPEETTDAA
jgi:MFS family permease